jgi:formate dehydrogenase subunit gamma
MTILPAKFRVIVGALALLVLAIGAQPAGAQQPTSVNPQASAVQEDQLLQELSRISGRCTLPNQKACTIEQPAGRDWRHFHEVTLRWIGGIAIIGILAVLIVFYLWRGVVRIESGRSGRTIVRFNVFERFVHWMTATCFIILAVSGLNISFGKPLLLPLIGPVAMGEVRSQLSELPIHAGRHPHLLHVDRRQYSASCRRRVVQTRRRHRRARPSARLPL